MLAQVFNKKRNNFLKIRFPKIITCQSKSPSNAWAFLIWKRNKIVNAVSDFIFVFLHAAECLAKRGGWGFNITPPPQPSQDFQGGKAFLLELLATLFESQCRNVQECHDRVPSWCFQHAQAPMI